MQIGGVPGRPGDVVRGDDSGLAAGTGLAAATGVDAVIRERSAAAGAPLP